MAHLPYIFFLILPIFSFRKPVPAFLPSWCHKMTNYTTPNLNFWPLGIRKNRFFLKENLKTPFFFFWKPDFLQSWPILISRSSFFENQISRTRLLHNIPLLKSPHLKVIPTPPPQLKMPAEGERGCFFLVFLPHSRVRADFLWYPADFVSVWGLPTHPLLHIKTNLIRRRLFRSIVVRCAHIRK